MDEACAASMVDWFDHCASERTRVNADDKTREFGFHRRRWPQDGRWIFVVLMAFVIKQFRG
jgi:hypothetical protein